MTSRAEIFLAGVLGVTLLAFAPPAPGDRCCSLSETQPPLTRTFSVAAAPQLDVADIEGPVRVVADSNREIRLVAVETVRGNSAADLAQARAAARLDLTQAGDEVAACVNGIGGGNNDSGNPACKGGASHQEHSWRAEYNLELHVPAATRVRLRTVSGDLKLEKLSGAFNANTVNGGVELDQMSGSGAAKTINGDIQARFAGNPGADCDFSTINGSLHLYFQPGLNAWLKYKTLNGEVYTDFDVARDGGAISSRREPGVDASGRIGAGGPTLAVSTINGSIFVHRAAAPQNPKP